MTWMASKKKRADKSSSHKDGLFLPFLSFFCHHVLGKDQKTLGTFLQTHMHDPRHSMRGPQILLAAPLIHQGPFCASGTCPSISQDSIYYRLGYPGRDGAFPQVVVQKQG